MKDFDILLGIIGFVIALIIGKFYIPYLRKKQLGQSIREDGPQSHLKKEGTPTMGGVIFILATLITFLIGGVDDSRAYICLFSMLAFGLIGFIDDALIIFYKRNEGLSPRQKFLAQIIVALIVIYLTSRYSYTRNMLIPFTNSTVNFRILHVPVLLFVVLGTVNSVNLTDGLDGLAGKVSIVGLIGFGIVANLLEMGSIASFIISLIGALLGFLFYNKYPAQIFMGDVGSLALGGAFAAIAIMTQSVLCLPIFGFIFVIETLSVIIQVLHYKRTGERIFKMSPLHHHFEESGWHETKVVRVFSIVQIIFTIIGILGFL